MHVLKANIALGFALFYVNFTTAPLYSLWFVTKYTDQSQLLTWVAGKKKIIILYFDCALAQIFKLV